MAEHDEGRRRLWRTAGVLMIAHVVLMLAGLSMGKVATVGASPAAYISAYVHGSLVERLAGGCVAGAGFLVFLLAATLLARLLRGESELGNWQASVAAASGGIYVALSLAVAIPGADAAAYDGHHGAPLAVVTALSDLHYFTTFASIGVLGLFTLALAGAGQACRALSRWVAYPGYAVGAICVAAVPGAGIGLVDDAMLVWIIWFVVAAVAVLRGARGARSLPVHAAPAAP